MAELPQDARREQLGGGAEVWVSPRCTFGTDALLLARFALSCAPRAERAGDLGTGCGVIPMLWAQERPALRIFAAELLPEGAALTEAGTAASGFGGRITVLRSDLRALRLSQLPDARAADLIACNPPYFPAGGRMPDLPERALARTEAACTVREAAQTAARLLRPGGWFCLIYRTERLCDALEAMRGAGLEPKRLRMVQSDALHAPKLFLAAGRRGGHPGLAVEPPLLLSAGGTAQ